VSAAAAFSFWGTVGRFAFAVVAAVVIGVVVGRANLWVRSRTTDPTTNTVLSFTVPFIASLPAEALGASGLVAAVVTGIVTGRRAPRVLSPQHRLSDAQNWRTVELVLEGVVFLLMGLQLSAILADVHDEHEGIGNALLLAAGALVLTLAVRAAYVTPLMAGLRRGHERSLNLRGRMEEMNEDLAQPDAAQRFVRRTPRGRNHPVDLERFAVRLRRGLADVEYFLATPLSWRDGGVLVWAGMRGAVTVAAAQTLPENAPSRSLLILIAFAVATMSLVLQGGTLARFVAFIRPSAVDREREAAELEQLTTLLTSVEAGEPVQTIVRQRTLLLDARDDGTFDAELLAGALDALDAQQISLEARGD
jgi:CPA1 family monovalent cation:H+ antiporter